MKRLLTMAGSAVYRTLAYLEEEHIPLPKAERDYLDGLVGQLDEEGLDLLDREIQDPDSPYFQLVEYLRNGRESLRLPAQTLLDFVVAAFLYPRLIPVLKLRGGHGVTVELAFRMEGEKEPPYGELTALYERAAELFNPGQDPAPFFHTPMNGDNRLLGFLSGSREVDERLREAAAAVSPEETLDPLLADEALCRELQTALQDPEKAVLLKGGPGRGKKFLLCHALQALGRGVVLVSVPALLRQEDSEELLRLLLREALFLHCGLCFHGFTQELLRENRRSLRQVVEQLAGPCVARKIPLYFCCDQETDLIPYLQVPVHQLNCQDLTRSERIRLWEGYAKARQLEIDPVQLGSKYCFSPEEIRNACLQLKTRQGEKPLDERETAELLRSVLPPVLTKGKIEPYHPDCTLDALVLPKQTKDKIMEICANVWYRHKVYDQWNMESKFAYGKAVSVLLSGPPGTGKTMTARVLSDLLQLPLYHVNLSQIVDKYIGETEKHLEEIFTNTEKGNLILFFDEADSVFGKRSAVNDSKDKYANTEVSYILQRIESFDGIVILATNHIGNIDPAFMRRMKYVIKFQLPDRDERLRLWQGSFPAECPAQGIDFDYLAEQFEFSGSSIKNAVLSAAFLAAQEDQPIQMRHLISGVKNEYVKMDKPVFPSGFGKYAQYV